MSKLYPYPPLYNWAGTLEFLKARIIKDVEHVTGESYARTVRIGKHIGWINVTHVPEKHALMMETVASLAPVLPILRERLHNLFDLTAQPDLINAHFGKQKRLKAMVAENPGMRALGAFDGFDMAIRGQQITQKAALTIGQRFADTFGKKIKTPFLELTRLAPRPEEVAKTMIDDIARHGIVSARTKCIIALSQMMASGKLKLEPGVDPETTIEQLIALPGIGPWTAHYIAMRALGWPDAFPKEDIALRNALGRISAKEAEALSQPWRPYRSYAVLYLWLPLAKAQEKAKVAKKNQK